MKRIPVRVRFKNRVPMPNSKIHSVTEFPEWNPRMDAKCEREGDSFLFSWEGGDRVVEVPLSAIEYVEYRLEEEPKSAPKSRGKRQAGKARTS